VPRVPELAIGSARWARERKGYGSMNAIGIGKAIPPLPGHAVVSVRGPMPRGQVNRTKFEGRAPSATRHASRSGNTPSPGCSVLA